VVSLDGRPADAADRDVKEVFGIHGPPREIAGIFLAALLATAAEVKAQQGWPAHPVFGPRDWPGGDDLPAGSFSLFSEGSREALLPLMPVLGSGRPGPSLDAETATSPGGSAPRHFWLAALETVGINVGVWAVDRYIVNAPFARISLDTWKQNLKTGFRYDNDDFPTNQALHSFHGSLSFNAARTNGLTFWESALFPVVGSLLWEYFGETQAASTNDLINTSLGGVTHGEIDYRLSTMLFDNTATGGERLWRELGGFVLNPVAGFNRLVHGETFKDAPNRDGRLPDRFSVEIDSGYQHVADGGAVAVPFPNQSLIGLLVRYGDPFLGENSQPFDYFEALLEFGPPAADVRWQERGQLHSWNLGASLRSEYRLGVFLNFDYRNSQTQVFSAQSLSMDVLSRLPLAHGAELRTELAANGYPLAAVQTDYPADGVAITTIGRPYDYCQGGGIRVLARLYRDSLDLLLLSYQALWLGTSNGISVHSTIESFHAEGRVPFSSQLAVGAGYTWSKRITSYSQRPTAEVQGPQWRVFGSVMLN
jgi:Domain of unknown function (DUF3943)